MKKVKIYPILLKEFKERVALGKKRYGKYLTTNNGRDVLQDIKDELWDALFYITQLQEEQK